MCLTKPDGVSLINTIGGYFIDRYWSAASLADSVSARNLEATVHYKKVIYKYLMRNQLLFLIVQ